MSKREKGYLPLIIIIDDTLKQIKLSFSFVMFFHSNSKKYGTCLKNKRAFNNWRRSAVFVDANLKLFNL